MSDAPLPPWSTFRSTAFSAMLHWAARRLDRRRLVLLVAAAVLTASIAGLVIQLVGRGSGADVAQAAQQPSSGRATVSTVDPLQLLAQSDGRNGNPLVLVAGRPLFPLPAGSPIVAPGGQPFEAQGVRVLSLVPGRGAWVGTSVQQRVFVSLPDDVTLPFSLRLADLAAGEQVNVSGRVADVAVDPVRDMGMAPADAALLQSQGKLVAADGVRAAKP